MPQINNLESVYFIFLLGGSVTIYCETCQLSYPSHILRFVGNRRLKPSALCKEGCNWSREKTRESRKPL